MKKLTKKYTITCGIGYNRKGEMVEERDISRMRSYALCLLSSHYGGVSLQDGAGGFIGARGMVVEKNFSVSVLDFGRLGRACIEAVALYIKKELAQESILLTEEEVEADFI